MGAGGAVYVQSGGCLTVENSLSMETQPSGGDGGGIGGPGHRLAAAGVVVAWGFGGGNDWEQPELGLLGNYRGGRRWLK